MQRLFFEVFAWNFFFDINYNYDMSLLIIQCPLVFNLIIGKN